MTPSSIPRGVMTDLGDLGGIGSSAVAINNSGQVVGVAPLASGQSVAFLYSNGVMQSLGTGGGTSSQAAAINNSGQIVGSIVANNFLQAFVYAGGSMKMLGSLGGNYSQAYGINDAGLIVGSSSTVGDANNYAFVYNNGVMTDLNTLVNSPTVRLGTAGAINAQGQILAEGSDDQTYLLTSSSTPPPTPTPVPTPTPGPVPTPPPVASPVSSSPPTPTPVPTLVAGSVARSASGTASTPAPASHVTNISCRAFVGTGNSVAIAGFVISGAANEQVLIRGVGPALSQFSVAGALAQPSLTVFNSAGTQLASNAGWGTNANAQQVSASFGATGAFALPSGSADSALLLTLAPGSYTAEVSGLNSTTGNALIEVYEVPSTQ